MTMTIYDFIAKEVNRIGDGDLPRDVRALRAFVGAYMVHEHTFGISDVLQAAIVVGGTSIDDIKNALTLIESGQTLISAFVLVGREPLARGARHVCKNATLMKGSAGSTLIPPAA